MLEDGKPRRLKVHYKSVESGEKFEGEYNSVRNYGIKSKPF